MKQPSMKQPSMKEIESEKVPQHNIIATDGEKEESIPDRPFRDIKRRNPEFTDRSYD